MIFSKILWDQKYSRLLKIGYIDLVGGSDLIERVKTALEVEKGLRRVRWPILGVIRKKLFLGQNSLEVKNELYQLYQLYHIF